MKITVTLLEITKINIKLIVKIVIIIIMTILLLTVTLYKVKYCTFNIKRFI
jgi:hypothetical protein